MESKYDNNTAWQGFRVLRDGKGNPKIGSPLIHRAKPAPGYAGSRQPTDSQASGTLRCVPESSPFSPDLAHMRALRGRRVDAIGVDDLAVENVEAVVSLLVTENKAAATRARMLAAWRSPTRWLVTGARCGERRP